MASTPMCLFPPGFTILHGSRLELAGSDGMKYLGGRVRLAAILL